MAVKSALPPKYALEAEGAVSVERRFRGFSDFGATPDFGGITDSGRQIGNPCSAEEVP
jgi:hypothetical protein